MSCTISNRWPVGDYKATDSTAPWQITPWDDLPLATRKRLEQALAEVTVPEPFTAALTEAAAKARAEAEAEAWAERDRRLRGLAQMHGFAVDRINDVRVSVLVRAVTAELAFRYVVTDLDLQVCHDVEILVGEAVTAYEAMMAERNRDAQPKRTLTLRQPESYWRGY